MGIEIKDVKRMRLRPKDILIIRLKREPSMNEKNLIGESMVHLFKEAGYDFKPQVLITGPDVEIEIMEPA